MPLDALPERFSADGLVRAGGKQRTDPTHVIAAVAALDRLELAGESVRAAAESLTSAHPGWVAGVLHVSERARQGRSPVMRPDPVGAGNSVMFLAWTCAMPGRMLRADRQAWSGDGRVVAMGGVGLVFRWCGCVDALAGLPPVRLHDLRHGPASLALSAGAEPKVVQELPGHSSIVLAVGTCTPVPPGRPRRRPPP